MTLTGTPTIVAALASTLATEPSRPLITFYDGNTDERIELSVVTFVNWVNKIANHLRDDLMLDAGAVMRVDLPTHWQSTVAVVGAWTAGLAVTFDARDDADVHLVGPAALADRSRLHGEVLACSLRPLGAPFADVLPAGWLDFGTEIPPQPDALLGPVKGRADATALLDDDRSLTHAELATAGAEAAIEPGLIKAGRLLTDANPATAAHLTSALVAPIVLDGSVILLANCNDQQRARIADQERPSARLWVGG